MGQLVTVYPCPVCNYGVEDELHFGGSGSAKLFLHNHYALATCQDCHHLVSVLVPNTVDETDEALQQAQVDIRQLELDAEDEDVPTQVRARDLLSFFRDAVQDFESEAADVAVTECSMCGSTNVEIEAVTSGLLDDQDAWVHCPRCAEGHLLLETAGRWD